MKKTIILLMTLLVLFLFIWLNFNSSEINGKQSLGSSKSYIRDNLFKTKNDNGYYNRIEKVVIYHNECKFPFTEEQMIEVQFADTRLKYPCLDNHMLPEKRTIGDNNGYEVRYMLKFNLGWDKINGVQWLQSIKVPLKEPLDISGSLFFNKFSLKSKYNSPILFEEKFTKQKTTTILRNTKLVETINEAGISIYEYTKSIPNRKQIVIKIDGVVDESGQVIILMCSTKKEIKKGFINKNNTKIDGFCSTLGWYISENLRFRTMDFNINNAYYLKQFYNDIHPILKNYVVKSNTSIKNQLTEK